MSKTIFVFSDSHGFAQNMLQALKQEQPDLVVHLGDGEDDLRPVIAAYPELQVINVRGNCDEYSTAKTKEIFQVAGKRFFATHGHAYNVREGDLYTLKYAAFDERPEIQAVLYGHTHIPRIERALGMDLINPGSCGNITTPTYARIAIDGKQLKAEILPIPAQN